MDWTQYYVICYLKLSLKFVELTQQTWLSAMDLIAQGEGTPPCESLLWYVLIHSIHTVVSNVKSKHLLLMVCYVNGSLVILEPIHLYTSRLSLQNTSELPNFVGSFSFVGFYYKEIIKNEHKYLVINNWANRFYPWWDKSIKLNTYYIDYFGSF